MRKSESYRESHAKGRALRLTTHANSGVSIDSSCFSFKECTCGLLRSKSMMEGVLWVYSSELTNPLRVGEASVASLRWREWQGNTSMESDQVFGVVPKWFYPHNGTLQISCYTLIWKPNATQFYHQCASVLMYLGKESALQTLPCLVEVSMNRSQNSRPVLTIYAGRSHSFPTSTSFESHTQVISPYL